LTVFWSIISTTEKEKRKKKKRVNAHAKFLGMQSYKSFYLNKKIQITQIIFPPIYGSLAKR